jgi:hypothetical protein
MTPTARPEYEILSASVTPEFRNLWDGPSWGSVPHVNFSHFKPESTGHRPHTKCKLLFDGSCLYGHFRVEDRYVRSVHTGFEEEVYRDSCVEIFLLPKLACGYFNLEFNCGGAMFASHVIDPTRVHGGSVASSIPFSTDQGQRVRIGHSLPRIVEPEISTDVTWYLEFSMPFALLEEFVGPVSAAEGEIWRVNFYKCGSDTSRPHWASWSAVKALNFRAPRDFGTIRFCGR